MKTRIYKVLSPILLFIVSSHTLLAETYQIDSEQSVVTLRMTHSLLGRFDTNARDALMGQIRVDTAKNQLVVGRLEFKPEKLSSLISLRDDHLKEDYLEVKKFPLIVFEGATLSIYSKAKSPPDGESFKGKVTVKGQTEEIQGHSKVTFEEDSLKGEVKLKLKITQFPIKNPKYMGVGVKDDVEVLIDLRALSDLSSTEDLKLNVKDF